MGNKQQVLEIYWKPVARKNVDLENKNSRSGSEVQEIETLFDTANNVVEKRKMRGDCVIRKGWCEEHGLKARKVSRISNMWTRSKKTGLYYYSRRKLSVLQCLGRHQL